ncbi:NAD(P)/FAD-dependent oxidoreductase [Saxibacter everestensis]|uniref:NAD(P)/FAD-dependent oxidoreductase n=1 Tax=Saxibacter everestensis TaxID=2909229 RepID=A0ABY8QRI6_9MICO|nr:NAD(P)/FAD-dependent oxidoreductase [Brevibacteriaceae bacterium ZFBP1038]
MSFDAIVVGAGPNGLAAAVTLARAGLAVQLIEGSDQLGGGARTEELTLSGYRHDVCSAVHPQALASPFFQAFGLRERIELVIPEMSYANPFDNRPAGIAYHSLDRTVEGLGVDGRAWRNLLGPLLAESRAVSRFTMSQLLQVPRNPITTMRFGLRALEQGTAAWNLRFKDTVAPALLTGVSTHVMGPLPSLAPSGGGLMLAMQAHDRGWPIPVGGSQSIIDAMAEDFRAHGGQIVTGQMVETLDQLDKATAVLLDLTPQALLRIAGDRLPTGYRNALRRFRYGNAACKVDFALSGPVPWSDERVREAGTIHLGNTRDEMAFTEAEVKAGRHPERPYVLASQPSTFDSTRAPAGKHTLWSYTHVPRGSTVDMGDAVERQIERFAPGFRDLVLARSVRTAADLEAHNPNYIGGDFSAGAPDIWQMIKRPVVSPTPWATPMPDVFLASQSTPPGPAVHGLSGLYAAQLALSRRFGITKLPDLSPGR